uniref:Golgin subfamily B member 1-like n=1 Tax=Rhizophora mucronata TaxID=61149 RepID=A0A2P2LUH4_RHIMU
MSRITKWKLEKTKVKLVFRLQFHATHIPQSGWDKLFVSFIPADSGKPTAKTTKANVRNGTCKWADPIYETTRLLQDIRTKKYDEKVYKLFIAMGSSRSSVLGEATINLADYADASKPLVVALPLHGCDFGTILHVTVQLLTSKTGFREFEHQRELRERVLLTDQNIPSESSVERLSSTEDVINDQMNKVHARVKFKGKYENLASLEEEVLPNEEYADSAVGCDGSSNTSESLCAEKHDTSSTPEIDSLKSTVSGDLAGLCLTQNPQLEKGDPSDQQFLAQANSDWGHGWSSDYSADNDLANSYEENARLRGSLEVAESSFLRLKMELSSLQSHADKIGHESQIISRQLADEIASGAELAKELSALKSESLKLKEDLEQLKVSKSCLPFTGKEDMVSKQDHIIQDLQLRWLSGLLAMEDKIRELQNKACFGYHENDFRFLQSDLEAMLNSLQDLKQGTGLAISSLNFVQSDGACLKKIGELNLREDGQLLTGTGFDGLFLQSELGMLHCLGITDLVSHEPNSVQSTDAMKGKILELLRELDESKAEREILAKKIDQMECYYEALVQELEESQRQMVGELQNLRNEQSSYLYTVSSTKAEMETMRQDLNDQILRLSKENCDLGSLNKELEGRAVAAEAALKRARLNYSIAVDQLQRDLELLSFQVFSMYETNENLIRQAFLDSSQPSFQKFPESAQSQMPNSGEFHALKLLHAQNQYVGVKKQQLGGDILLDDLKRSLHLQEGLYRKVEEEVCEMHCVNIYLDVLSKTLQETLLEANDDVKCMKEKLNVLMQQLDQSNDSSEKMTQKLHRSMDEVHSLNECKATYLSKCNDLALQNQSLEGDLQNVLHENHLLMQNITEWESLYTSYERKFNACAEEKTELAYLLEKKIVEHGDLLSEKSSLQEELKVVRSQLYELASGKESLQQFVKFLKNKLCILFSSDDKIINGLPALSASSNQDLNCSDLKGVLVQLEELQHGACEGIHQLMEQKKCLLHEKDIAQMTITEAKSEIVQMKNKFECDVWNMANKLDESNSLAQKLQLDIEAIATRFKVSSEAEEKYAQQHEELFADLDHLEAKLQELISKNGDLAEEIMALETVNEELGRSKVTALEIRKENQDLMASLQDKNVESTRLTSELDILKESLKSLQVENQALMASITIKMDESAQLASELNSLKDSLLSLQEGNKALTMSLQVKTEEADKLELDLNVLKENLQLLHDENQVLRTSSQDTTKEYAKLDLELNSLKQSLQFLHEENQALRASSLDKTEESAKLASEVNALKESLQFWHKEEQAWTVSSQDRIRESAELPSMLKCLKECFQTLQEENQTLMAHLQDKSQESAELALQLNCLRESFESAHGENQALRRLSQDKTEECSRQVSGSNLLKEELQTLHAQLHDERTLTGRLRSIITDLSSQLNDKQCQLLQSVQCESELVHLKNLTSNIEAQLLEMHELYIAADVKLTFTKNQQEGRVEELVQELHLLDGRLSELQEKHINMNASLSRCLCSEAEYMEQNASLLTSLNSVRQDLEASSTENRLLFETNRTIRAELEGYMNGAQNAEPGHCEDKSQYSLDIEMLKGRLLSLEEEIDNLMIFKEEMEVIVILLKAKLVEQQDQIISLEGCYDQTVMLRKQCNELMQKLSEQILKTEEFRHLSVHLKELKDKADMECNQAHEKRQHEASPVAMHESLRIAFIKEQYETRVQELKHQLSVSKKHSEEMLWKLQDAVDELENRKKSEASHLKKNEELGKKIIKLESELQSVISNKREKMKAYDLMKAEMECSLISLECCKEEKQKLENSLEECKEEKSKLAMELTLIKEQTEKQGDRNDGSCNVNSVTSDEPVIIIDHKKISAGPRNGSTGNPSVMYLVQDGGQNFEEAECASSSITDEVCHSSRLIGVQPELDAIVSTGGNGPTSSVVNQEKLLHGEMSHLLLINDQFRAKSLKSSMDHLSNELERMKNENLHLGQTDCNFDQKFPELQRELMQLAKANEELGSMFPLYGEFSGSGSALERVLALEIELAEALQAQKKSSLHFQSSFLKQHSDKEAVFKSFRDINELIKDMLDVKGRYGAVEAELREMHDRYSQLSLQFAEVEGDRQKLLMTLKSVRASKKALQLNHAPSFSDHSS